MAPRLSPRLVLLCFFGSGMTGLIYELVWTRRLQLVFGSTTFSIATVLAAFMAGLGLGSYVVGRRVDARRLDGFRLYAQLELGIAAFAAVSLALIAGVEQVYALLQRNLELGQGGATLLKFALSFPVLAFPAGMMGGTLPALVRAVVRHRSALHRHVGRLYGINTIGAAAGTLLCGLVMIELFGLWASVLLAAVVNLMIALVVFRALARAEERGDRPRTLTGPVVPYRGREEMRLRRHLRRPAVLFCAVAVVLTGLLSMSYEVVWTRLLSLTIGSSTYAFTLVLGIFLVGISLGSLAFARFWRDRQPTVFALAMLLFGLALWAAISLAVIPRVPHWLANMAQAPDVGFYRVLLFEILFAVGVLLVPTLILGATLPMAMGIIGRALGHVGRDVGGVYLANTMGAIAGSLLTGFFLIPLFGTRATLMIGLVANVVLAGIGLVGFASTLPRRVAGLAVTALVVVAAMTQPPWPSVVFDSGLGYRLDQVHGSSTLEIEQRVLRTPTKLLFLREGVNATISVRHYADGGSLLVNGKPDASTSTDMRTQSLLGLIPGAVHAKPVDFGVVGWGSGVTAYVATLFPTVKRVDVIEIERAVVEAAPFFHRVNGAVERDPRVRIFYDDARSHFLTREQSYDVIVSEPSNPWMLGVSALFSRDFYESAKKRLKPGGIFAQWLQTYRIDAESVAMVLRTLLNAFPHVQLWYTDPGDLVLLGSEKPIRVDYERLRGLYEHSAPIRRHMAAYGPGPRAQDFFGCFLLGRPSLRKIVDRFPEEEMTDNHPVLEYRAVRNLYEVDHPHLHNLWQLKMEQAELLPPLAGSARPQEASALVGALRLVRTEAKLADQLLKWSRERFPDHPELELAHTKQLIRRKQPARALESVRELATTDDLEWKRELALTEARALLSLGKASEALTALEAMGEFRPIARRLYELRAALQARQFDLAFDAAADVLADPGDDVDALQLKRNDLLRREVRQLIFSSRQWKRGIALLQSYPEQVYDGAIARMMLLVELHGIAGQHAQAATAMDQVQQLTYRDRRLLELCEPIYMRVDQPEKAARCRAERRRLFNEPVGPPLWPLKPRS